MSNHQAVLSSFTDTVGRVNITELHALSERDSVQHREHWGLECRTCGSHGISHVVPSQMFLTFCVYLSFSFSHFEAKNLSLQFTAVSYFICFSRQLINFY